LCGNLADNFCTGFTAPSKRHSDFLEAAAAALTSALFFKFRFEIAADVSLRCFEVAV
jgi:hypothetical protein